MAQSTARVMGPHGGRSSEGSVGVLQRWTFAYLSFLRLYPPLNFLTLQLQGARLCVFSVLFGGLLGDRE